MLTRFFNIFNFINFFYVPKTIIIVLFSIERLPIFKFHRRRSYNIIGELIITFLQFLLILKDIRSVEVKYLNEI
jgi:hypothetical protein